MVFLRIKTIGGRKELLSLESETIDGTGGEEDFKLIGVDTVGRLSLSATIIFGEREKFREQEQFRIKNRIEETRLVNSGEIKDRVEVIWEEEETSLVERSKIGSNIDEGGIVGAIILLIGAIEELSKSIGFRFKGEENSLFGRTKLEKKSGEVGRVGESTKGPLNVGIEVPKTTENVMGISCARVVIAATLSCTKQGAVVTIAGVELMPIKEGNEGTTFSRSSCIDGSESKIVRVANTESVTVEVDVEASKLCGLHGGNVFFTSSSTKIWATLSIVRDVVRSSILSGLPTAEAIEKRISLLKYLIGRLSNPIQIGTIEGSSIVLKFDVYWKTVKIL
ncbi:hypothetical protein M9H77_02391 [Catharanthus roseus]|uniref:Uncharacterized protein n=1 Tax=Catharanthus roseus TaxID=4058 RepID=A0ACC0C8N5_CATRO|nr:hypothetical protein M9H77_02391 [Catharanthus roseus]